MMVRFNRQRRGFRRGAVAVLATVLSVVVLGMVAFAVDLGHIVLVRTELQAAADSAALAAAAASIETPPGDATATAKQYAGYHTAGSQHINVKTQDVEPGTWDFNHRSFTSAYSGINAVRVTTRRDRSTGGASPLFFGRVFGPRSVDLRAQAVAAYCDNFSGFSTPKSRQNLPILPIAMKKRDWESLLAGHGSDQWSWDSLTEKVIGGRDGFSEVDIYPQNTGSSGNCGTIDIGRSGNSTADLKRQILEGASPEDLSHHGGALELGADGTLLLNGDTGISAGIESALTTIRGQSRIIPIFDQVTGPGNNAQYRIVAFAGIRVMDVRLSGSKSSKRLVVQRANIVVHGGIPAAGPAQTSYSVYSPVRLVQ